MYCMTTYSHPEPSPNQTGVEMFARMDALQAFLKDPTLTPDARGPMESDLASTTERFLTAAAFAESTGIDFSASTANPETETTTETTELEAEPEPIVDLWALLTPEQSIKAKEEITRLAEAFERNEADFGLIKSEVVDGKGNKTGDIIKVILTATNGIHSFDPLFIYHEKRTWENALEVMKELNLSGITLEDAEALAQTNPKIYEWVWRTGEQDKVRGSSVPVACVSDNHVGDNMNDQPDYSPHYSFRPAVVIA